MYLSRNAVVTRLKTRRTGVSETINIEFRVLFERGTRAFLTRILSQVAVQNRRTRHQIRYTGDGFGKHTDGHVADQEGGLSRVRRNRRHQMQIPRRM